MSLVNIRVPHFSLFAMDSSAAKPPGHWFWKNEYGKLCTFANEYANFCLPVDGSGIIEGHNAIRFQIFAEFDTEAARDAWLAGTPLAPDDDITVGWVDINTLAFTLFPGGEFIIDKKEIASGPTTFDVSAPGYATARVTVPVINTPGIGLAPGDCFAVGLSTVAETPLVFSEECFNYVVPETKNCYVSRLQYWGNDNQFGFEYCTGFQNDILLPFYISRPQFAESRKVFSKSNGDEQLVSSVTKKSYELRTDYFSEHVHEVLNMALSHDNVYIIDLRVLEPGLVWASKVVKSEDYSIGWHDTIDTERAPARARVTLTPYEAINSNCDTCNPICLITVGPSIELFEVGDPIFGLDMEIVINLAELNPATVENCPEGIFFQLAEDMNHEYVESVTIDPVTGIANVVMRDDIPVDYYEVDQPLFYYNIGCNGGSDACTVIWIPVNGTISYFHCPHPPDIPVAETLPASFRFTWSGPPVFMPEPLLGYELRIYNFALPYPGLVVAVPATGLSEYQVEVFFSELAPDSVYAWTLVPMCNELGGDQYDAVDPLVTPAEVTWTLVEDVCRANNIESVCGCPIQLDVYIAGPSTILEVGAFVYSNAALTIFLPPGYIVDPFTNVIFQIGASGEIVDEPGDSCP